MSSSCVESPRIPDDSCIQENFSDDDSDQVSELTSVSARWASRGGGKAYVNKTFTPYEIREIDRENAILMDKILACERKPAKPKVAPANVKKTSAAINRKKDQMRIDWENQILLRKIKSVKPSIKH